MRFYGFLACPVLAASLLIGCSSDGGSESLAGIEIGNPAFALTADFSVDYTEWFRVLSASRPMKRRNRYCWIPLP